MKNVKAKKRIRSGSVPFGGDEGSIIYEALFYLAVFISTVALFYTIKPLYNGSTAPDAAVIFTVTALAVTAVIFFLLYKSNRLDTGRLILLLIVAGVIIRIGYMLKTPASVRQYDTFTPNFDGHEGYAMTIYRTGSLPTKNVYQFYHPPLNAFVQAAFMRVNSFLVKLFCPAETANGSYYIPYLAGKPDYVGAEEYFLYETCQMLAVLYSVVVMVASVKIISLFSLSDGQKTLASAIAIFFPRSYQFSALLNNDALALVFALLALYFAIKWHRSQKNFVHILLSALFLGFGMMTKLSAATVALPIGAIFLFDFIVSIGKEKDTFGVWKLIAQYAAFIVVCAPMGLWFQIYAKIRFDQPFGYVFPYLNKALSTADVPLFERLFITFDRNELFGTLYIRNFKNYADGINNNYNLLNYSLRSAVFGEFYFSKGAFLAVLSLVSEVAFCALFVVAAVYAFAQFINKLRLGCKLCDVIAAKKAREVAFVIVLAISQIGSLVFFYIKMPYSCTMDFRYIMPLISVIALSTVYLCGYTRGEGRLGSVLSYSVITIEVVFLALSSLFYIFCI